MANDCCFDMRIRGTKQNISTFCDWMQAYYQYYDQNEKILKATLLKKPKIWVKKDGQEISVAHHIGFRIFDFTLDDEVMSETGETLASGWGSCAWSCYTCMFRGESSYLDKNGVGEGYALSLPEACKELGLDVELFSVEPGFEFAEHFKIDREGNIEIQDVADYDEVWIEDSDTYEEFRGYMKRNFSEEFAQKVLQQITEEIFNRSKENDLSYVCVGGFYQNGYEDIPWQLH